MSAQYTIVSVPCPPLYVERPKDNPRVSRTFLLFLRSRLGILHASVELRELGPIKVYKIGQMAATAERCRRDSVVPRLPSVLKSRLDRRQV
jgi:hypothetical protein